MCNDTLNDYVEKVRRDLKALKKAEQTGENLILKYREQIKAEIEHWDFTKNYGCQDPFWSDGANMNLTRNHVIWWKKLIFAACEEFHTPLPEEFFLPVPDEIDKDFMAPDNEVNPYQKNRIERINGRREAKNKSRMEPKEVQLSFL